jgi:hypothetical protein
MPTRVIGVGIGRDRVRLISTDKLKECTTLLCPLLGQANKEVKIKK